MNWAASTHKRDWLFDAETLRHKYAAAQQQALESLLAAAGEAAADDGAAPDAKKQRADCPISLEDEAQLKLYYQVKVKAICQQLQLPSKVLLAALLFFKRFYTQASCLEHDPTRLMPACIYLACKVEESYRSADSLAKGMGIEAAPLLRYEVPLLQGLRFDLVVHSPYRALEGLFKEFDQLRAAQSPQLDAALLSAPADALASAHSRARESLGVLVLTDAPLLHPPGLLAVAALRSGFRRQQLACRSYLAHVAERAAQQGGGGAAAAQQQQQPEQALLQQLAAVDEMVAAQGQVDEAALQQRAAEVDRAIKLWRKGLAAGQRGADGGGGSKGAAPAAQAAAVVAAGAAVVAG